MNLTRPLRISMQFFAEGAGSSNGDDTNSQNNPAGDQNQQQNNPSGATFTQSDLNRIGAQEKANGKKSMLKELGFDDEQTAKDAIAKYNEYIKSQQTEVEQAQAALATATKAQTEAESKAALAERRCSILLEQGNPKYVNDIMAIANSRITEDKDFDAALKSVKEDFPTFFTGESGDTGTGGAPSPKGAKNNTNVTGIGARLAQNRLSNTVTKNPYFK